MSTASLPSYAAPLLERTPTYTAEPQAFEQRLALNRLRPRPSGEFTKQSKSGALALRLFAQENNASLPVYGAGALIDGAVEIARPEGVNSVEVKVSPRLVVTQRLPQKIHRSKARCGSRRLQRAALSLTTSSSLVCSCGAKTETRPPARPPCPLA